MKQIDRSNTLKALLTKRTSPQEKERNILFGLVELYIQTAKPIGSKTLQQNGFDKMSSATIRNYFAKLEAKGYLYQQHTSGGRVPTPEAFSVYADHLQKSIVPEKIVFFKGEQTKEVKALLHRLGEEISTKLNLPCFVSLPVFEHDFIQKLKCHLIDREKLLCVLITDYGQVKTEILQMNTPITEQVLHGVEEYFLWRIGKGLQPSYLQEPELFFAKKVYAELMLRQALAYGNEMKNSLFKTGLCYLMDYPELNNAEDLSSSLLLFENEDMLYKLIKETMDKKSLCFWIGKKLETWIKMSGNFSIISIPYFINQTPVGAIALTGPCRLEYQKIFPYLIAMANELSENLTQNVYKHKIPFHTMYEEEKLGTSYSILLENKSLEQKEQT